MDSLILVAGVSAFVGLLGLLSWRWLRRAGREIQLTRIHESYHLQRERLEEIFLKAAASTGKPRGLLWKRCELGDPIALARDRKSGELLVLIPATISFEAVEGGPMEGVAAVGNLRNASAVFTFFRGEWRTAGRAVFNLNPDEVIGRFGDQYVRVEVHA
jgi:hypothetical protein